MKTCHYNFDLFQPHFHKVKLGFTGVYIIFLISAQKHRLWVLKENQSDQLHLRQSGKHKARQSSTKHNNK